MMYLYKNKKRTSQTPPAPHLRDGHILKGIEMNKLVSTLAAAILVILPALANPLLALLPESERDKAGMTAHFEQVVVITGIWALGLAAQQEAYTGSEVRYFVGKITKNIPDMAKNMSMSKDSYSAGGRGIFATTVMPGANLGMEVGVRIFRSLDVRLGGYLPPLGTEAGAYISAGGGTIAPIPGTIIHLPRVWWGKSTDDGNFIRFSVGFSPDRLVRLK